MVSGTAGERADTSVRQRHGHQQGMLRFCAYTALLFLFCTVVLLFIYSADQPQVCEVKSLSLSLSLFIPFAFYSFWLNLIDNKLQDRKNWQCNCMQ